MVNKECVWSRISKQVEVTCVSFLDEYAIFGCIYLIHDNFEVFDNFKEYNVEVEIQLCR